MGKKALLTDLGNVLVTFMERTEVITCILRAFGCNAEKVIHQLFPKASLEGRGERIYEELDNGQMCLRQVWENVCSCAEIDRDILTFDRFFALYCRHLGPLHPVIDLYRRLQESYPLIAVSNGDAGARHAVDFLVGYHGIRFEEVFISAERRMRKPELLGLAKEYLQEKGYDSSSCVFVDDIAKYTEAAEQYGFPAIQFNGVSEPITVLQTKLAALRIQ